MSRVVVTGGAGFIGSTLCDVLLARGDEVTAVDNLSTGTLANLDHASGHPSFTFIECDVRDTRLVDRVVANHDAVLHNRLPPKTGRLYAIRTNLAHVDEQAPADDTFQEWACWAAGMRIVRVDGAVVANRGPRTIRDYLRIRRRVIVLHTNLLRRTGYRPATMRRLALAKAAWRLRQFRYIIPMTGVLALEVVALAVAAWDVRVRRREYVV